MGGEHSIAEPALHRVLIAVDSRAPWARGTLAGIRRYMADTGTWQADLPGPHAAQLLDYLEHRRPDGVIGWVRSAMQRAAELGLATVGLSSTLDMPDKLKVYNDPQATAGLVAEHFAERELTHLTFCSSQSRTPAMQRRADLFEAAAKSRGCSFALHTPRRGGSESMPVRELNQLARWLDAQPRPFGLWAIDDACGWDVLQACEQAGLSVPHDVAVVGYKNDVTLCDFCKPTLSSVMINQERIGYLAAELLDQQMRHQPLPDQPIRVPPLGIVLRESSDTFNVADPIVSQAMQYIRDHVADAITVDDVLDHVPTSASTLTRRFNEHMGRSPHQAIRIARLDAARRLLATTDMPLADVAASTGFGYLSQFCRDFKRENNLMPTEYRDRFRFV